MLAVLTGDVVDSSDLSPQTLTTVMTVLDTARAELAEWVYPKTARFARREGDGWQIALEGSRYALRAALFLQASLRAREVGAETRISLATGIGTMPSVDLNAAYGPVFTASGRGLAAVPPHARLYAPAGGAFGAVVGLADAMAQGWTVAQARALTQMLGPNPPPRRAVAGHLGISRQAVDQALGAAGFHAISAALLQLEAEIDAS